jgi:D-glycero-D-manno-heptose 1,7-bisphosphate phosphatase
VKTFASSNKVVVLDRDGTIVIDRGYLDDPAGLEFLPGAVDSLRRLNDMGYRLVIVTNQSGVGRGMFSVDRLGEIHDRLAEMMRSAGVRLEGIYYCPHTPDAGCSCRKPATGLLFQAASELGFEPSAAIVIGDKMSDVEFGSRAGATTILLSADGVPTGAAVIPDFVATDMTQAAQMIYGLQTTAA